MKIAAMLTVLLGVFVALGAVVDGVAGRWGRQFADAASLVVVTRDITDDYRKHITAAGVPFVLRQTDREVSDAFGAVGTPSAVFVEMDGTIGSQLAVGAVAIRDLLNRAEMPKVAFPDLANGSQMKPNVVRVGTAMPPFRLPDVNGKFVDSDSFGGRSRLLLFWNPECGFCTQMLPEERAWQERKVEGTPALVVISMGTVEANRALGLRGVVLHDPKFTVAPALGVTGTPSAALFDADGTLLAPIAVGAPSIFAMVASAVSSDVAMAEAGALA